MNTELTLFEIIICVFTFLLIILLIILLIKLVYAITSITVGKNDTCEGEKKNLTCIAKDIANSIKIISLSIPKNNKEIISTARDAGRSLATGVASAAYDSLPSAKSLTAAIGRTADRYNPYQYLKNSTPEISQNPPEEEQVFHDATDQLNS